MQFYYCFFHLSSASSSKEYDTLFWVWRSVASSISTGLSQVIAGDSTVISWDGGYLLLPPPSFSRDQEQ